MLRPAVDIIDAHAHAFPEQVAAHAMRTLCCQWRWWPMKNTHDGTVQGLLGAMDRAGITKAIVCSTATKPTQVEKITDWSAGIASERLIPFASIHPAYEHIEREVERAASLGIRGLKFHPQYMDCALDDPRAIRIARAAAKHRMGIEVHSGHHPAFEKHDEGTPRRLMRLRDAVPDLKLMGCHLAGMDEWQDVIDMVVGSDVYLETSFAAVMCPMPELEKILTRHDPRRIVFGTDSPWQDQKEELGRFERLPLPPEARRLALGENAARFIAA